MFCKAWNPSKINGVTRIPRNTSREFRHIPTAQIISKEVYRALLVVVVALPVTGVRGVYDDRRIAPRTVDWVRTK